MTEVSSANFSSFTKGSVEVQSLVQREKSSGELLFWDKIGINVSQSWSVAGYPNSVL